MKLAHQGTAVGPSRVNPMKRVTRQTSFTGTTNNNIENENIKTKGMKRNISDNSVSTRKRTAFGDITNAIQAHADRMSIARNKCSNVKENTFNVPVKVAAVKETQVAVKRSKSAVVNEGRRDTRNRRVQPKRNNSLKTSQSTSALTIPVSILPDSIPEKSDELSVAEQCDDILLATTPSTDKIPDEEIGVAESVLPEGVIPFDLDQDPNTVSEYAASIFKNMKTREQKFPITDYLSREGSLTTGKMRAILIDWLVEVQENFELYHETLYYSVSVLDHYLQLKETPKDRLQLAGATALLIACKIEEHCPPPLDDFLFICDGAYTAKQFMQMEVDIMKVLDFDINMPISYRFLRRFSRVNNLSMEILTLSRYLLEISLMSAEFVDKLPSKMAASCLCLAMTMKGNVGGWNVNHIYHTGYTELQLVDIMRTLNEVLLGAQCNKLQTIRRKYSHPTHFQVAKTRTVDPRVFEKNYQSLY